MSESARLLLEEALRLTEADRATIAGALIESLHGPADSGVEAEWRDVVRRRVAELDSGSVATVPWSEVRERLFDGFD